MKILWLALAGGLGTLCRYGLTGMVQRLTGSMFPWGTISVNMIGSFLFGLLWAAFEQRVTVAPEARLLILTGFMGAFTTFSTFMFESGQLLRDGEYWMVFANIGLQNIVGIVLLLLGLMLGRMI